MKKNILLLALILGIGVNAQTAFEKGNFVNNQNQVVECLIKNYDWASIPKEIEYKINENDEPSTMPASQLNSFYIYGTSHNYKTYDVPITGIQKGDVSVKSGLQLLKVLVEGKASLLKNNDGIYILALEEEVLKPLIYKRYINGDRYEENVAFRLELYNTLKCKGITQEDFKKLRYVENQLIKVVNDYNNCQGGESINYKTEKSKADFNLKVVAGANYYKTNVDLSFRWTNSTAWLTAKDEINLKGDSETNIVLGFEAEVRLPYNHKKWSVFIIPTFNKQQGVNFKESLSYLFSNYSFSSGYKGDVIRNDNTYLELPLGLRRYFILNKNSEINVDISYGVSLSVGEDADTKIKWYRNYNLTYETTSSSSLLRIGGGYNFKEKYSVSVNYYAMKNLAGSNTNGSISVLLGYKIF